MAKFKYGDSGRGYGPPSGTGVARDRPLSTVLRPAPAGRKKRKNDCLRLELQLNIFMVMFNDVVGST